MIDLNNKAFGKGLASVFIVSSPLQVLCAQEAIKEFCIEDYLVIFQCEEGDIRNEQVLRMMDKYSLNYQTYYLSKQSSWSKQMLNNLFNSLFCKCKKYDRVFIGDYHNQLSLVIALRFINFFSHVIYLDDGTSTIPILKGLDLYAGKRYKIMKLFLYLIFIVKFVFVGRYFFTLYHDYETSKIVYPNNFANIGLLNSSLCNKSDFYFIGTNSSRYAECYLGNDEDLYKRILFSILGKIKKQYPDKRIYYIPHGKDNSKYIQDFCNCNDIIFMRLPESVESFFVSNNINPEIVCGFVSSALFNLKKIFPESRIINYFPVINNTPWKVKFVETSLYYEKHGIEYNYIDADCF